MRRMPIHDQEYLSGLTIQEILQEGYERFRV